MGTSVTWTRVSVRVPIQLAEMRAPFDHRVTKGEENTCWGLEYRWARARGEHVVDDGCEFVREAKKVM